MRIPVGRIIRTDMGNDKWGMVLYMVINPPIICETCGAAVFEWRSSEEQVICPACENVIKQRNYLSCPTCGQDDYHTLRVVNNNNWQYDSITGQVTQYCDKRGIVLDMCGKSIQKDIKSQKLQLMTSKQTQDIKRKLVWTGSMDYQPTKPMPQWVIDKFPYDAQE